MLIKANFNQQMCYTWCSTKLSSYLSYKGILALYREKYLLSVKFNDEKKNKTSFR